MAGLANLITEGIAEAAFCGSGADLAIFQEAGRMIIRAGNWLEAGWVCDWHEKDRALGFLKVSLFEDFVKGIGILV